jgi:hypothetical protein
LTALRFMQQRVERKKTQIINAKCTLMVNTACVYIYVVRSAQKSADCWMLGGGETKNFHIRGQKEFN